MAHKNTATNKSVVEELKRLNNLQCAELAFATISNARETLLFSGPHADIIQRYIKYKKIYDQVKATYLDICAQMDEETKALYDYHVKSKEMETKVVKNPIFNFWMSLANNNYPFFENNGHTDLWFRRIASSSNKKPNKKVKTSPFIFNTQIVSSLSYLTYLLNALEYIETTAEYNFAYVNNAIYNKNLSKSSKYIGLTNFTRDHIVKKIAAAGTPLLKDLIDIVSLYTGDALFEFPKGQVCIIHNEHCVPLYFNVKFIVATVVEYNINDQSYKLIVYRKLGLGLANYYIQADHKHLIPLCWEDFPDRS